MLWLLEQDTFGYDNFDSHGKMCEALHRSNIGHATHPKIMYGQEVQKDLHSIGVCIPRGSIDFIRTLQRSSWNMIVEWADWSKFEFTHFANLFSGSMLSDDYIILPYKELRRRWPQLRRTFGGHAFFRPNSGMKQFAGHVASINEYASLVDPLGCNDQQLIIVASAKQINVEHRLLVVDKKIVTATRYMQNGRLKIERYSTGGVVQFLEERIRDIVSRMPSVFVVDVAEIYPKEYKIIECNAFNTSELYDMNYEQVVQRVTPIARRDYLFQGMLPV